VTQQSPRGHSTAARIETALEWWVGAVQAEYRNQVDAGPPTKDTRDLQIAISATVGDPGRVGIVMEQSTVLLFRESRSRCLLPAG
jgi:hypothetical protein